MGTEPVDYCREIETYLCRKNDGHLIRVVGPSFELVSRWAADGVPLKIAFRGIDRYVERYYAKGPRRRPVKIDFCEADVLEAFDEWRRAVGLTQPTVDSSQSTGSRQSLPGHLERVVLRLTQARANGSLPAAFDEVIDRIARELDIACGSARGVRGAARQALLDRLAALDVELLAGAREMLDEPTAAALAREADNDLAGFKATMPADAWSRAREAAVDRLVRERFHLPVVAFV